MTKKVQVVVFLKNSATSTKLLLLKTNERRGSFWQNITGSVDDGENFRDAAKRELLEETGINSEVFELEYQITFFDRWKRNVTEKTFYTITDKNDITLDPSEHDDFKWVDLDLVTKDNFFFETNFQCFLEAKQCLK